MVIKDFTCSTTHQHKKTTAQNTGCKQHRMYETILTPITALIIYTTWLTRNNSYDTVTSDSFYVTKKTGPDVLLWHFFFFLVYFPWSDFHDPFDLQISDKNLILFLSNQHFTGFSMQLLMLLSFLMPKRCYGSGCLAVFWQPTFNWSLIHLYQISGSSLFNFSLLKTNTGLINSIQWTFYLDVM